MNPALKMMMTVQIIWIPVGLPCAGKTTMFDSLQRIEDVGDGVVAVSPDQIREQMYPGYEDGAIPFKEIDNAKVFERAESRLRAYVEDAWDIWFDATNISDTSRWSIYSEATRSTNDLHFIVVDMDVPFEEIVKRNKQCRRGYRSPSIEVLQDMHYGKEAADLMIIPEAEVWRIRWDDEWMPSDDFDPPELCLALLNMANAMT